MKPDDEKGGVTVRIEWSAILVLVLLLILFHGEPDLLDALIARLQR